MSPENPSPSCFGSFLAMWDVSDVKRDISEHLGVVGMLQQYDNLKNILRELVTQIKSSVSATDVFTQSCIYGSFISLSKINKTCMKYFIDLDI